jgi:hypothetical protein
MRIVHWVSQSNDKKIGKIVASYSPKESCPDSCSLKSGGCYAWGLFYLNVLSSKLKSGKIQPKSLLSALEDRRADTKVVRHRVAGDVVNDVAGTMEECKIVSDHSLINIGYTHAWQEEYVQPLKRYFRASCQSVEEVLEARKMGWSASLIVSEQFMSGKKTLSLPNGETAFLCPARHGVAGKKDITCNDCTLCKVSPKTESKTVVFIAHGNNGTLNKIRGKIS